MPISPPFKVKKSSSPSTTIFNAAGSLPGSLSLSAKVATSTRPPVSAFTAAHISTSRLCRGLSAG